ncbi:T9SS type A sorting domain-containing protein [Flammeovirga sp. SubArs3]|uniref:InlB B-repeat-containing protein n=1 Tax=Flammeovirga sp. SubArs3 TaxID=2995316 RepID=UPI00248B4539|nr:T9SS type A sorting domain-containing protein [Flammeovirga sp. SubArs3]
MIKHLILIICILFFFQTGFSQEKPLEGDGSISNPYQIENVSHLLWLSKAEGDTDDVLNRLEHHYILMADIDLTNVDFVPIGSTETPFKGTFDGRGYTISSLSIDQSSSRYLGLFGVILSGTVHHLQLNNVNVSGERFIGTLAGKIDESTIIHHIIAKGTVHGERGIGGIIGEINNKSEVSYIQSFVATSVIDGEKNVGGIAGVIYNKSSISQSYVAAVVTGSSSVGPLVGAGHFASSEDKLVSIKESYWDKDITGLNSNEGIADSYGLTVEEFKSEDSFLDLDFENIWKMDTNSDFSETSRPYLSWIGGVFVQVKNENEDWGAVQGEGYYSIGEQISLKAVPNQNVEFVQWELNNEVYSDQPEINVTVEEHMVFEASFEPAEYLITEISSPRGKVIGDDTLKVTSFETVQLPIFPKTAYEIEEVFLNGNSIGTVPYITLSGVSEDIVIEVKYKSIDYQLPEGEGTAESPYVIRTLEELRWFSEGDTTTGIGQGTRWRSHVILDANIYAEETQHWNAGLGFFPIGTESKPFRGHFNGQHYEIHDLVSQREQERYIGLFGYSKDSASIRNLQLLNVDFKGDRYVGALLGKADSTNIENIVVSGKVEAERLIGGAVGELNKGSHLSQSASFVDVSVIEGGKNLGGLVGTIYNRSSVNEVYAVGSVENASNSGGLIGNGHKEDVVSVTNAYWDRETTGLTSSHLQEDTFGLSTSAFSDLDNFVGWASSEVNWSILINTKYDQVERPYPFELQKHWINVTANRRDWGVLTGNGRYLEGEKVKIKALTLAGHYFIEWQKNGEFLSTDSSVEIVVANHNDEYKAILGADEYIIEVSQSDNGTITPGTLTVFHNDDFTFQIVPDDGYEVDYLLVDQDTILATTEYTFKAVTQSYSFSARFKEYEPTIFIIPAIAGENGSITPLLGEVSEGEDITFDIIPDPGYEIDLVFVGDDNSIDTLETDKTAYAHTFENVWNNYSISATFKKSTISSLDPTDEWINVYPNPFTSEVNILVTKPQSIQIINLTGQVVYQQDLTENKTVLSLTSLPRGIYIIKSSESKPVKIQKK